MIKMKVYIKVYINVRSRVGDDPYARSGVRRMLLERFPVVYATDRAGTEAQEGKEKNFVPLCLCPFVPT